MSKQRYQELIDLWCRGLSPEKALVKIFEKVRDIPYGSTGERDPQKILKAKLGSCSGKHLLLKELFDLLGYQAKIVTCYHHFDEALPKREYPKALQNLITEHTVIDFHHFIQIKRNNRWLVVDATWDTPLKAYGFPVNTNWSGDIDTQLAVKPIKFYPEVDDLIAFKEQLIAELEPEERAIRKRFLDLLTDWFATLRISQ